jgi:hypothetical protein
MYVEQHLELLLNKGKYIVQLIILQLFSYRDDLYIL